MKKIFLLVITILSLFAISCFDSSTLDSQIKQNDSSFIKEITDDNEACSSQSKEDKISNNDTGEETIEPTENKYNQKVSEKLILILDTMSDEEYVCVYVDLQSPQHSPYNASENHINQLVNNRVVIFERNLRILNEGEIEHLTFKELTVEQFKQASQIIDDIYNDTEIENMIKNCHTITEIFEIYERTKSMHNYRQKVKLQNQSRNQEFYEMLDKEQCCDISMSTLLTNVTLKCKKTYIFELQEIAIVSEIYYNEPDEIFDSIDE